MVPSLILLIWFFGLLSFAITGGAIYLLYEWYQRAWQFDPALNQVVFAPHLGFNQQTALLAAGLVLLLVTFFGGALLRLLMANKNRTGSELDPPRMTREGTVQR